MSSFSIADHQDTVLDSTFDSLTFESQFNSDNTPSESNNCTLTFLAGHIERDDVMIDSLFNPPISLISTLLPQADHQSRVIDNTLRLTYDSTTSTHDENVLDNTLQFGLRKERQKRDNKLKLDSIPKLEKNKND